MILLIEIVSMSVVNQSSELLSDFPVVIELPVQWGDQDALGHANNVVFFRWLESSRISYCERIGLLRHAKSARWGTVLASIQCDFRRQLIYPDKVIIGARATRIGNSSIGIEHRIVGASESVVAAEATSTIVMFDFEQQQSVRVSDEIRTAVQELEHGRDIDGA
jgi:acyl-CoA thioester hydrolase